MLRCPHHLQENHHPSAFTEKQMAFIGPHQRPKILGKKPKPTSKVTPTNHQKCYLMGFLLGGGGSWEKVRDIVRVHFYVFCLMFPRLELAHSSFPIVVIVKQTDRRTYERICSNTENDPRFFFFNMRIRVALKIFLAKNKETELNPQ